MNKLLAVLITGAFAFAGAAIAQDKKTAEPKKPTADECKKDPKMKGCEPAKKDAAPAAAPAAPAAKKDEMKTDAKK
jgi:hypothetical protein